MLVGIEAVIREVLAQKFKMLRISFDGAQPNVLDPSKPGGNCARD
jgi:hypothetical protein